MVIIRNINEFKRSDLNPSNSFNVNDILNPDVWDGFKLKPEIKEKLNEIANEFVSNLYGDFSIYDIVLIGSLASYNWSEYSDFDIHIVLDFTDINDDTELVQNYFKLYAKKFNKEHDIMIYNYEVELYIEDKTVGREHINGLYSLLKDKWIKRPSPDNQKEVDVKLIENKAINIMSLVDDIEIQMEKKNFNYNTIKEDVNKLWDKIKKARKDGISSPDGEYAIGNLVFKYLRRNGYIGKMISIKKRLIDIKYSL